MNLFNTTAGKLAGVIFATAIAFSSSCQSASAQILLGDGSYLSESFSGYGVTDTIEFSLGDNANFGGGDFSTIQLQNSNVGQTFTITSTDNPALFAYLTSATPAVVVLQQFFTVGGGSGWTTDLNSLLTTQTPGFNGQNFAGFNLTSITFTINSLDIRPDTVEDQTGTSDSVNITVDFNGVAVVPEPSTWALILSGLGLLALFRRHARRN